MECTIKITIFSKNLLTPQKMLNACFQIICFSFLNVSFLIWRKETTLPHQRKLVRTATVERKHSKMESEASYVQSWTSIFLGICPAQHRCVELYSHPFHLCTTKAATTGGDAERQALEHSVPLPKWSFAVRNHHSNEDGQKIARVISGRSLCHQLKETETEWNTSK